MSASMLPPVAPEVSELRRFEVTSRYKPGLRVLIYARSAEEAKELAIRQKAALRTAPAILARAA